HHHDGRLDAQPFHRLEHAEAVEAGHEHVEQHQVHGALLEDLERGASVGSGEDVVTTFENYLVSVEHARVVVYGQNDSTDCHQLPTIAGLRGPRHGSIF